MVSPVIASWGAKRWGRVLLPLAMWAVLSGCTSVQLVSSYDPVIDKGVGRYAEDLGTFIAKMSDASGTPKGAYKQNLDFYAEQNGKLGALVLRAQASDPGLGCVLSDKAVKLVAGQLPEALRGVAKQTVSTGEGCTVRMLKNIKTQLGQLQDIHQSEDGINAAIATTVVKITSQSIRAVLSVEAMKKRGLEQ